MNMNADVVLCDGDSPSAESDKVSNIFRNIICRYKKKLYICNMNHQPPHFGIYIPITINIGDKSFVIMYLEINKKTIEHSSAPGEVRRGPW